MAPDDCVGIFVEPSPELLVGVWGVLFSGAAYLPLSPEYPEERLRYMVEDAGVTVVYTQDALRERLAELAPRGTRIVTWADAAAWVERPEPADRYGAGAPAPDELLPEHLGYVIYTSGSTGRPKGVTIEQRSIANQLGWLAQEYGLGRGTVVLQKTPVSFDAAQWEILSLACGATVVAGRPGLYRDPDGLIDAVIAHGVTALQCVPTLLQALLDTERLPECRSLTQLFSGGEALSRSLALRFVETLPWCQLVNLYGPTECTINASALTVVPDAVRDGPQAVSIGTPVAGTSLHILDGDRRPAAVGEIGELYIGGVQVARGYLGRPELTAERFVPAPPGSGQPDSGQSGSDQSGNGRLFRTGDLAHWNADGTVQFVGRADSQVKLRGFRVELDEIRLAVEAHDWVRNAAVLVRDDHRTGFQNLVACVELNPNEAALMDQGNHGAHHQSKQGRLQVRAQLSNPGLRAAEQLAGRPVVPLPGRDETPEQRRLVFARKTYRYFTGGQVTVDDILRMLRTRASGGPAVAGVPDGGGALDLVRLGEVLRYFGQFHSEERLLPKYGYASPGSLYATQLYVETTGYPDSSGTTGSVGLPAGRYYYHPGRHELVRIGAAARGVPGRIRVHFVGRRSAIEPVYRNNIQEVLEIETGHMVGLFEEILPRYGLDIRPVARIPGMAAALECADEDFDLGTFEIVPWAGRPPGDPVDIYVQAHPGKVAGLPAGQYRYAGGELHRIADELVERKHVIAINQRVYERASIGISVVSRTDAGWLRYVDLGRALQRLSMNGAGLGFMSSGYSSDTGNPLPSARRIDRILADRGLPTGPSYFFVGGKVSEEQRRSEGMNEDTVHMSGPAEMIREDLVRVLPDYMVPNKVVVLDALPVTANGKIDVRALAAAEATAVDTANRPQVPPRTQTERQVGEVWKALLRREIVSVHDDFFASGGNSLVAVRLINRLNRDFAAELPVQVLFEAPTVAELARRLDGATGAGGSMGVGDSSRVVPLQRTGNRQPVFCWPGLGGYTMNLRLLARAVGLDRPIYGIQAKGINPGETPCATVEQMAAEDVREIRRRQPAGPYTLWGYSFGARVAFEAAYQLEQAGERVEQLFLIAPGMPRVAVAGGRSAGDAADLADPAYVAVLLSVFAGAIDHPALDECLRVARDDDSFARFVSERFGLDADLVRRVATVVSRTYESTYTFRELARRRVAAPVTIFKARGDDYSFLESSAGYAAAEPTVVELRADHYGLLSEPGIGELVGGIRRRLGTSTVDLEEGVMPHVNIKHFPVPLTEEQQNELVAAVTNAVKSAFSCDEGVISIALEPVDKESWNERVYLPEIVNRKELLRKTPRY